MNILNEMSQVSVKEERIKELEMNLAGKEDLEKALEESLNEMKSKYESVVKQIQLMTDESDLRTNWKIKLVKDQLRNSLKNPKL